MALGEKILPIGKFHVIIIAESLKNKNQVLSKLKYKWFTKASDEGNQKQNSLWMMHKFQEPHCLAFADIENTYKVMGELEKLSKTVKDILDCRIEAVLQDMSVTALCDLPEDEPVTMDKFLELTATAVDSASKQLAK